MKLTDEQLKEIKANLCDVLLMLDCASRSVRIGGAKDAVALAEMALAVAVMRCRHETE